MPAVCREKAGEAVPMLVLDAAKICIKVATIVLDILQTEGEPGTQRSSVTETIRCAGCGEEAWVVRWGSIRVGQDLSGWYAQASTDSVPVLLCRGCWHRSIGMDDYSAPTAATVGNRRDSE